jgi:hypothetical protein
MNGGEMTRKFGQARREAFLAALRETGNHTIAAERAKVSRSWVTLHKASDPEFARACGVAVEEAKAALRQAQGEREGCGAGYHAGEELVVRGTGGAGGGKRVQVARARLKQWSPRVEARFLSALAATCNVKAACAEVGLTPASAYNHRKRWPRFAERWDAAVEIGYLEIESGLVAAALVALGDADFPGPAPLGPMTVAQAIHVLHMHQHAVRGIGKAPGKRWRPPPSLDDPGMREGIMRKLEMFARVEGWRSVPAG